MNFTNKLYSFLTVIVFIIASSVVSVQGACELSSPVLINPEQNLELRQYLNPDANSFTMELTYTGGQSFVAIGVNENGQARMSPSKVILGRADLENPSVDLYRTQSYAGPELIQDDSQQAQIVNSSFVQTEDTSVLTFTYTLGSREGLEINDETQWVFAVGFSNNAFVGHSSRGSFKLSLTDGCSTDAGEGDGDGEEVDDAPSGIVFEELKSPKQSLWMTHGILMTLAWAVCAPLSIGASLARNVFDKMGFDKGTWYKIHYYGNVFTTLFTITAFIIALVAKKQQLPEGSTRTFLTHGKVGISIFVLVIMQSAAARFRPALPKSQLQNENSKTPSSTDRDINDIEKLSGKKEAKSIEMPPKSTVRLAWEYGHRLVGVVLLALSWYNCHTGIGLLTTIFADIWDFTGLLWALIGVISAFALVGKVAFR